MRRHEVFRAASEGAGINFLIAIGATAIGGALGPYGPSVLQAATSIALGLYLAESKPEIAIATMSGGILTASALATAVAARNLALEAVREHGVEVPYEATGIPFRPGHHLPQPLPGPTV